MGGQTRRDLPAKNVEIEHFYGCDICSVDGPHGIYNINTGDVLIRNCTIAKLNHASGFAWASEDKGRQVRGWRVEDSIFASQVGTGEFYSYSGWTPTNSSIYTNPSTGLADAATAGLVYGVRVDPGTTLNTAQKGATILKRYGASGALMGDPCGNGHMIGTAEDLWPWPNEATIKTAMTTTFGDATRGWTAGALTLTQYIWRKLGAATGPP
jgi:hypothetical protein